MEGRERWELIKQQTKHIRDRQRRDLETAR